MIKHRQTMQILGLLLFVSFLTSCASVSETYAPDGKKAYALNCSGVARGWDKCQKAAGDLCSGKGYEVVDKSSEEFSSVSGSSTSGFFGGKTHERSMLITCKE